ncbi:TetR/AcrR family transcriptional regulator [Actinokineospora diospyrosa]|uniref:TetR/AcrR family transcriptional regulator n=1 Tax=Actinokineospora diospyrosa TaxID=103728 RepID=UPI0020A2DC85|nr:TetR family transcriptional regulator C-terminal domain-containing protein [Actinokineospora diospyrosa]
MPRRINPEQRDRAVVEAAWRVLTRDGLTALSVRNVAAEAHLPPSSLRYTFPTQASVRERAVDTLVDRLRQRVAAIPEPPGGPRWAHAALLELLPLDDERRVEMEVTLALGAAAMTDPDLRSSFNSVNAVVREVCTSAAAALGSEGKVAVDHLHALIDGLAFHLVRRTHGESTEWALKVLDAYLPGGARFVAGWSDAPDESR